MTRFFTRERFGRPQFLAGALLLAFLAQAVLAGPFRAERIRRPQPPPSKPASPPAGVNFTARASPARLSPISRRRFLPEVSHDERLRHRTLSTALPRNRRASAGLAPAPARSRIFRLLALAPAPPFPGLRTLPRRVSLVRSPPPLRQHRRISGANPLLLFPVHDPGQRRLAHRA